MLDSCGRPSRFRVARDPMLCSDTNAATWGSMVISPLCIAALQPARPVRSRRLVRPARIQTKSRTAASRSVTLPLYAVRHLAPGGKPVSRTAAAVAALLSMSGLAVGSTPAAGATAPTCRGYPATIVGTPREDVLTGTQGGDVIVAMGGDDVIRARGGADVVCGADGDDQVYAGADQDRVWSGD